MVDLFQEALESDGYKVCGFIDPVQAFSTLEKKIQEYGLILSDYRMPNLNSYELCTKLTPDGPVMYSGSYTCFINTISIEKRRFKKNDS